jgi:hypothetical protein
MFARRFGALKNPGNLWTKAYKQMALPTEKTQVCAFQGE